MKLNAKTLAAAGALLVGLLGAGIAPVAEAQWTNLSRLGTNDAVCPGGVETSADLQKWFAGNRATVQQMFQDAGFTGNTDAIMSKVASGDFTETMITAGTEMQWMGRRKNGRPTVKDKVRYVGKKGEPGIALQVVEGCNVHDVIIPLTCCNVALVKTSPMPAPGTPSLDVQPPASCDGGVANVTASTSSGSNVELTMTGPDGSEQVISAGAVDLLSAGDYQIRASAVSACGARSAQRAVARFNVASCPPPAPTPVVEAPKPAPAPTPAPPKAQPEPKPMAKARALIPFMAGAIGAQSRTRDLCYCIKDQTEGLVGGRGGLMYPITDRLSAFGQIGAFANTEDSKWSTLHADVGLEMKVGESGFIGGGVGVWDLNNSLYRDPTAFIHGGVDTPWKFGDGTVQWFIEGRKWLDENFEDTEYDNDYSGLTGLRVMFK